MNVIYQPSSINKLSNMDTMLHICIFLRNICFGTIQTSELQF